MSSSSSRSLRVTHKRSGTLADLRHAAEVAAAYDALAPAYNQKIREDQWMREVLWRHYRELFRAGDRVLDVGCGTGLDTLYLARQGIRMTGIDLSSRMVAELEAEGRRQGIESHLQVQVADASDLPSWPGKYFHGIISAFAGLNTVRDLGGFAADAARLLLPRGRMVVHMLAPGDHWERRLRVKKEGRKAAHQYFRRRHRSKLIAGQPVSHRVISLSEAYHRYFEPYFRLCRRYVLGFLLPQHLMARLPRVSATLVGYLESFLGRIRPFRHRSRFIVLDLESRIETL